MESPYWLTLKIELLTQGTFFRSFFGSERHVLRRQDLLLRKSFQYPGVHLLSPSLTGTNLSLLVQDDFHLAFHCSASPPFLPPGSRCSVRIGAVLYTELVVFCVNDPCKRLPPPIVSIRSRIDDQYWRRSTCWYFLTLPYLLLEYCRLDRKYRPVVPCGIHLNTFTANLDQISARV
jgi:hypothetical protein